MKRIAVVQTAVHKSMAEILSIFGGVKRSDLCDVLQLKNYVYVKEL